MLELFSVLFVYRAIILLQEDDGPYGIFDKLRQRIAPEGSEETGLAKLYGCPWCLSVWIAIGPAVYISRDIWQFFIYMLGLSGGAMILKTVVRD